MSGTIELSDKDRAYLAAANALRSRFPDAAKYLERLVWDQYNHQHEIAPDPENWPAIMTEWIKDNYVPLS